MMKNPHIVYLLGLLSLHLVGDLAFSGLLGQPGLESGDRGESGH